MEPKGRQDVTQNAHYPMPAAQKRRSPTDARAYIRPLVMHIIPCLPRKRGGSQGTPGRASDPLALYMVPRLPRKKSGTQGTPRYHAKCTLSHACRAKKAKPKGRQGIYPTLGNAHYPMSATQKRWSPRNARAYIQPPSHWTLSYALTLDIVPRLPRKRGGAQGTPGRISDPW